VEEQRFDSWTRAVAHAGSRRRLLRALLGAGAALVATRRGRSDALAHHGMAGPGEACRTDSQCVAADAPMVCAWNGYGSAGAACCTYAGSNCADDAWCCGTNVCIGGTCTSQSPSCTGEGCDCLLYRDPGCLASCPLYDPCDAGLVCTGTSEVTGTCVASQSPGCIGPGCDCTSDGDCGGGLMCCVQGDPGAPGTCQTMDACPGSLCTSEGCACTAGAASTCQDGLVCCSGGGPGAAGTCLTDAACNAPNCIDIDGACDPSCAWGDSCWACCSGYCNNSGQCDFAPGG
jgi:hypothetical protein